MARDGEAALPRQADIPQEAAEEEEGLRGVSDQEVVARINRLADAAREKAAGRYRVMRHMMDLYLGRWPWTGKERWQSKVGIPRPFTVVQGAVALYAGGMQQGGRWFTVEDEWRGPYERVWMVENIQRRNATAAGLYDLVTLILQCGLIGGTAPVKVGLDSEGELVTPSLQLIDPCDLALDWTGRHRWLVLDTEVDPWTLRRWAQEGFFEEDRVEAVLAEAVSQRQLREGERNPEIRLDEEGPTISLREFWGDLASAQGELWVGNGTAIVAGGRHLLRPPRPNPFRRIPVVLGQPLRVCFKVFAPGLLEYVSGMAKMLTELACAVMDSALFASVQAYQYDVDRLDPAELLRGIYPGKAIGVTGLADQGEAIRRFAPGEVPHDVPSVMQLLSLEIEKGSGVTEQTSGLPTVTTARRTAREWQGRLAQTMQIFRTAARDLEVSFFEPLLDRLLELYARFTARDRRCFFHPALVQVLGPQIALLLAQSPPAVRERVLSKGIRHQVHGLSGAVAMNEELQRLLALAATLRMDPEMWQAVKKLRLAQLLVEKHRADPEALLYSEQELAQLAARAQLAQAAQARAYRPPMVTGQHPTQFPVGMAQGRPQPGELQPLALPA